jgi:Ca-activated chloride channel family protein
VQLSGGFSTTREPAVLELAHPMWLLLIPVPLFLRLLPAFKHTRDSVRVPFFARLLALSAERPGTGAVILSRSRLQVLLVGITWLCLVLAAARPEWVGEPIEQTRSARDLMVAVDLSGSMQATDFSDPASGERLDRLQAVKRVLAELARQRQHDRLGLLVFGSAPYVQTPFTEDHATWKTLLQETEIGMAGQSTVFGDAIGLAIYLFEQSDTENRVLIMLTDGNDTGSKVPPAEAAKVAASYGIRIHTIAIGDPTSVGEEALDKDTLRKVASLTGGGYYQAMDQQQLASAYQAIAELEPELYETTSFRPRHSIHYLPVAFSVALYLVYHVGAALLSMRRERLASV